MVILAVNDVYRIEGLEGGAIGGLARLRTLRRELEREHPGGVLLPHGGDAIFPSFMSHVTLPPRRGAGRRSRSVRRT